MEKDKTDGRCPVCHPGGGRKSPRRPVRELMGAGGPDRKIQKPTLRKDRGERGGREPSRWPLKWTREQEHLDPPRQSVSMRGGRAGQLRTLDSRVTPHHRVSRPECLSGPRGIPAPHPGGRPFLTIQPLLRKQENCCPLHTTYHLTLPLFPILWQKYHHSI